MRVTNSMLITNMLSNLNTNLNTMSRKQDELSTGKRVIFASDDPVAAAKILKFKADIADMYQYSTNTRDAQAWLDATESTVAEMGNVLQRARELAVQAANGTNTPSDTQKIKEEITQLRDHLISSGNFNFAGRYIFSSHYTDKPLLTKDGKYNIPITADDLVEKPVAIYEVSVKERMPVGTHGLDLFGFVTDTTAYQTQMPDASSEKGSQSYYAGIKVDFDLTNDYTTDPTTTVTVNGMTFTVDKTALNGTPGTPLNKSAVETLFKNATETPPPATPALLSSQADVYFDGDNKLVIRSKQLGATGNVQLSAFSGMSNAVNVTNPSSVTPLATVTTAVSGIDGLSKNGKGAEKAALQVAFNLKHDYTTDATTTVTVDGTLYTVDKTKLKGSAGSALDPQAVLDLFRNAPDASTGKLSDKADVYFDSSMNLVIRTKSIGTAGSVQLSNFSGVSSLKNITDSEQPISLAVLTTKIDGTAAIGAEVTAGTNYATADLNTYLGKQFVMTYNGVTKVIEIPAATTPATITTDAQLQAAIQGKIDAAFGAEPVNLPAGTINIAIADGTPIKFTTNTAPTDPMKPTLRIQPVKGNESQLVNDFNEFITALETADKSVLGTTISKIDLHLNQILTVRADIGARVARIELIDTRISENNITFTKLLSDAQDADMSEVIMHLKNAENVYKSALSVGGRIIQPSLLDFLR